MEQYLASLDIEYLSDFEALRKNPSTEVDSSLMGDTKFVERPADCSSLIGPGLWWRGFRAVDKTL